MSLANEFRYIYEEVKVFLRNLGKDSIKRRNNLKNTHRKIKKLNKLKKDYSNLKDSFNSEQHELSIINNVKEYVNAINRYLEQIENILESRVGTSLENLNISSSDSESDSSEASTNMSEKFDLKTAASLLPVMDGSENVTKQLIDAIELYDSLLDADGKKLLTTYILKTRLSQNAKIRLRTVYTTNTDLVADLKNYFLTKKSASTLSLKLNNARQGTKSIESFGTTIEELMVDLTISQAEGDQNSMQILTGVNEKLAINAFANGLNNNNLRTIVKARNYSKLSEAIRGAKDEELPRDESHIFNMRGRATNRRVHSNFRVNIPSRNRYSNNFSSNIGNFRRSNNLNHGSLNNNYGRGNNNRIFRGNNRSNFSNRGGRFNQRSFNRGHLNNFSLENTSEHNLNQTDSPNQSSTNRWFFRESQE